MKTLSRVKQTVRMCRPFLFPFGIISVLIATSQSAGIVFAYFTGTFIGSVDESNMSEFWRSIIALTAVVFVGKFVDTLVAHVHIDKIGTDMQKHISLLTLKRSTELSIGQVINQNSGFSQTTIQKGEAAINELAHTFFFEFVPVFVRVVATLVAFFFLNLSIGFLVLASTILFTWSSISINKKLVPRIKKNRKEETKLDTFYWEIIKHLRLVISSSQHKKVSDEVVVKHDNFAKEHKSIWLSYIWKITYLREPFASIGQVLALGYAGYLVMQGELEKSNLIVIMGWLHITFGSLGNIGSMQRRLVRNFVLTGKYFDLLDIPSKVKEIEGAIEPGSFSRSIEFRNVSFKHPEYKGVGEDDEEISPKQENGNQALEDVTVTIQKGEVVALVGPSGSGKSTFVNLLLRGYDPDQGEIVIDGHNLAHLKINPWRRRLGLVEQEPKLWDETLRYNILFGLNGEADSVTEKDLEKIAQMTRIDEFYQRLEPKRFNTLLGENGIQLSGGQRQRVAIARALIKNPDILILDEATNALDPTNERLVHEAIRGAMKERTGIIIAHRLSTIRRADKIIVFEKGKIVGVGTHAELMVSCKSYQELVECENQALEI